MTEPPDLAFAVGRRMRELRDAHHVTADAVATQARYVGLGWQRSTVASIETGKRGLSAEELLLLPMILTLALPTTVRLRDLLDQEVAMTEQVTVTPAGFRELFDQRTAVWGGFKMPRLQAELGRGEAPTPSVRRWGRVAELWPEVRTEDGLDLQRLRQVERAAAREAEQKAARSLGVSALEVSALSHRLWGRSLTAERDQRVESDGTDDESPAAMRARRGHVTRALLDELAELVEGTATDASV